MKKRTIQLIDSELKMLEELRISMIQEKESFDKIMLIEARISQMKSVINLINLGESE
ncbi:hypothetical protein [Desulfotignum phosphitoxidans]|uniref:Uncharacterized protein n=1 Tax=Desulfotignum phosphitoxidans DSM 13687 TaxID=1286635 RepID=S0FQ60_9BACT|nr:hypothetical protein [Desulfotignum phosphitoxidans]EMS77183.1 hypothetical protein Dpo_22c00020 [Desulfotignum phosphitoxidans DSM 13687]